MPSNAEEAAAALRAISNVQMRAAGFQDYRAESGQLILWGLVNMLGCAMTALFPEHVALIWLLLSSGAGMGIYLARRSQAAPPGILWRYLLVIGSILLFTIALHVVMWPVSPRQSSMIMPLLVATLYAIRGAQSRPRYLVIALCLAALCLSCFTFASNNYWWWMALALGGTFIGSGFWLRRP